MYSKTALFMLFLVACSACATPPSKHDQTAPVSIYSQTAEIELLAHESADRVYSTNFEKHPCWFPIPAGASITCGYLKVPENHAASMTLQNTIRLAIVIFHSSASSPEPDPVVYQVGGPGGHMLSIVPNLYEKVIQPFLEMRDVILFDPRGTGFSQPELSCNEKETPEDCIQRLFHEGHNLYAYNSISMVQDLIDMRDALGYDHWNLLGESYGSFVAQIALRESPPGLRSVILDSVVPLVYPELSSGQPSFFHAALQRLFQSCKEDPTCNASYPDLENSLHETSLQLDSRPVEIKTTCYGKEKSTQITGDRFLSLIFDTMYETEQIASLPYALAEAKNGDYSFWNQILCWEYVIDYLLSDGTHWAVLCGDGKLDGQCEDWPVVINQKPVSSEIPTLILNGEFDPVTPLEFGHAVAKTLSCSYSFDFPGFGHWVNGTGHPCQRKIIQRFLDDPSQAPDSSCIQSIQNPTFVTSDGKEN